LREIVGMEIRAPEGESGLRLGRVAASRRGKGGKK